MTVEMGKISSRGQVAIPSNIRDRLGLHEGSRVLFFTQDDTLVIRKVTDETFAHLTAPLKAAAKKAGLKESDVPGIVERFRERR